MEMSREIIHHFVVHLGVATIDGNWTGVDNNPPNDCFSEGNKTENCRQDILSCHNMTDEESMTAEIAPAPPVLYPGQSSKIMGQLLVGSLFSNFSFQKGNQIWITFVQTAPNYALM